MPSFAQIAIWCSFASDPGEEQAPLHFLDVRLDPDLLPLLLDHLGDLGVRDEGARRGQELDPEPSLAVDPEPVTLAVLLRETDLVQQRVGLLDVERRPLLPPLRSRVVRRGLGRRDGARDADAEPERLVQLVPVDAHRQRPPEVGRVEPLRHLGVRVVGVVDLERGVGAVQRRVELDVVADLVPVLEEHRELGHRRVALLEVVLAGDRPEVQHLEVLSHGHLDAGRCTGAGCPRCRPRRRTGSAPSPRSGC